MERLQKVLAAAGIGSRRQCEEFITEGRVEIDRQSVTELGVRVDAQTQEIRFDGEPIKIRRKEYYVVNKPPGVLSTNNDPSGRLRVIDLIGSKQRVFTVGRLDKSSEGLMIVTNDGDLAQQLTHPKFGCHKTYHVTVAGDPKVADLEELKRGVRLSDGFARIHDFKVKKRLKNTTVLEIILKEGRNREIRRLLAKAGHKVTILRRVAIGPIRLADLPLGAHRRLDTREVRLLRQFSSAENKPGKKRKSTGGRKKVKRKTKTASSEKRETRTGKSTGAKRKTKKSATMSSSTTRKPRKTKGVKKKSARDKTTRTKSKRGEARTAASKQSGAKKKRRPKRK